MKDGKKLPNKEIKGYKYVMSNALRFPTIEKARQYIKCSLKENRMMHKQEISHYNILFLSYITDL